MGYCLFVGLDAVKLTRQQGFTRNNILEASSRLVTSTRQGKPHLPSLFGEYLEDLQAVQGRKLVPRR